METESLKEKLYVLLSSTDWDVIHKEDKSVETFEVKALIMRALAKTNKMVNNLKRE